MSLNSQLNLFLPTESLDLSCSNEWYTPEKYIDLVRQVFGGQIDLDPASNAIAQSVVKAQRFYTKADDGLTLPWSGKVFCNPPYSKPIDWVEKAIAEIEAQRAEAVIMLLNAATPRWFQLGFNSAARTCFVHQRINFWNPAKNKTNNDRGQIFFYWGREPERFAAVFRPIGVIGKADKPN